MKVTKAKALECNTFTCVLHAAARRPAGHLDAPLQPIAALHSTGPRFASALGPAAQSAAKHRPNGLVRARLCEARAAQRAAGLVRSGGSKWSAGRVSGAGRT